MFCLISDNVHSMSFDVDHMEYHAQLAKTSFDEILDVKAVVFNLYD